MLRVAEPVCGPEERFAESAWRFPLELVRPGRDPLSPAQVRRWIAFFLILGVAARTARYVLRFPLWEDECFLCANLLDRGYAGLMGPLSYDQVCPLGFLWIELTMVKLLGFQELSLRLFPFVCGVAGLFLFRHLAGRFLKGTPLVLAVGIFAVAYPGIRYAAEAKQYGSDLFLSLALMALAAAWWRRPDQRRWLWALAALIPLCVGISYPAVFVGGGISLFAAWLISARRDRGAWIAWLVYNAALVGTFGLLFAISAANQSRQTLQFMQHYWHEGFPPLDSPLKLGQWLVATHTGALLAYPFGGQHAGSTLTAICCLVGLAAMIRRRQYPLLLLWLAPLGLTLVAASLHRYPYGQMVKFQIYLAPVFCMLAGAGAALMMVRFQKNKEYSASSLFRSHVQGPRTGQAKQQESRGSTAQTTGAPEEKMHCTRFDASCPGKERRAFILLSALALVALATMARDFSFPAKSASVMRARDFARWFWFTAQFDGEVACLKTDLNTTFAPGCFEHGLSSMYLCNQRIYSPRHAQRRGPQWDRVAQDWPLRCVEYHPSGPYDRAARDRWLAQMQTRYELVGRERYPFVLGEHRGPLHEQLDYLEVYKFVPRRHGKRLPTP